MDILNIIRRWELWGALLGTALIVFGAIWLTTIFSGFKKIPTDYDQTIDFQGTYAVVGEQEFLQQLLTNASIQQLVASPSTLTLLADPAAQQLLTGGDLGNLLADPALMQQLLTNLPALQQAADPAIQQALADPVAASQSTDPVVQQLLANPTLLSLLTNPVVQSLLTNPAVPALLTDPVIQGLLVDPSGLALVADPRTLQLLADPSNLPMVAFPVNFHRVREAESTDGDLVFLHQDFDATVLGTGQPLDQFSSEATLAVNRETREYVPDVGGTERRRGGFAFPFDVKKDQEYDIWIHEVFQPITATFTGTDEVEGLKVYVFQSQVQDLALPDEPKRDLGIPETLDLLADVVMVTKTEPKTGITVDVESSITYRLNNPALGNPVVFKGDIQYSSESIATSVDDANDARGLLFWFGGFLPWSSISLGLLMGVVSVGFAGFRYRKA